MCGIVAIVGGAPPDTATLEAMAARLAHHGPDGAVGGPVANGDLLPRARAREAERSTGSKVELVDVLPMAVGPEARGAVETKETFVVDAELGDRPLRVRPGTTIGSAIWSRCVRGR